MLNKIFKKFIFCKIFFIFVIINNASNSQEIRDLEKSKNELTAEANQGNVDAQYSLGRIALENKNPPDHSGAAYWFRIAAESNHIESQEILGALLFSGLGVPAKSKRSIHLVEEGSIIWKCQGASKSRSALCIRFRCREELYTCI